MDSLKVMLAALFVFAAACGCPSSELGTLRTQKYTSERDAACAAVEGCEADFMASVKVVEVTSVEEIQRVCEQPNADACYCLGEDGCQTVFLRDYGPGYSDSNALHEMVHAALDSVGKGSDHGPEFQAALVRATENYCAGSAHKSEYTCTQLKKGKIVGS